MEEIVTKKSLGSFAKKITEKLEKNDCLFLIGDLGAGKTALVKEISKILGLKDKITSPTFVIMKIYQLQKNPKNIQQLVHIDGYRLEQNSSNNELLEYINAKNSLSFIEWPEKINLAIKNQKTIQIEYINNTTRKFSWNF